MKQALFVSSVLGHKKVEDRLSELQINGYSVRMLALDWSHGRSGPDDEMLNKVSLATVRKPNSRKFGRVALWLRLFNLFRRAASNKDKYEVLIANTLEMVIFAELFFGRAATFKHFDFADVHRWQYSKSGLGSIVRFLERRVMAKGWSYVVTSPWFYWKYAVPLVGSSAPAFLVENRPRPQNKPQSHSCGTNLGRYVILWNGILRCNTSARALMSLAQSFPDEVVIRMSGKYDLLAKELVRKLEKVPNIQITGPYSDDRLDEIYGNVTHVWVSDFDDEFNSAVLLPNRLYQAIAMGRRMLAAGESASSSYVKYLGVGAVAVDITSQALWNALESDQENGERPQIPKVTWSDVFLNRAIPLSRSVDLAALGCKASAS